MEPNLKAKENHAAPPQGGKATLRRWTIVTIAAAVSSVAMGLGLFPLPFLAPAMAQAQQADRICHLSDISLSPLTTRQLIEQDSPCPLPPLTFQDASGKDKTLADFHGSVVLLNLWATWCPPCIREMPALNALQQRLGSDDFKVVAISQDRGGAAVAGKWLSSNGFTALPLYLDPTASVGRTLESPGLPVTLLIDRQGRELARLYGPADWDSDDMIAKLRQLGGF
jgi:thiol-disulfide isomerase/thioredoxin